MTVATPQPQLEKAPEVVQRAARPHRPWWRIAAETVVFSALAVVTLECGFNLTGIGLSEFLQPDVEIGCRHIADKRVVWRMEGFSDEKLNKAGLRDVEHTIVKPPGVVRIALLGDSATEALQVRLERTYARLLEQKLKAEGANIEVLNFGCSSYSTGQEYLQLKNEVAQYKPDITILMYNRGDNLENVRNPSTLSGEPRPYFFLDQTGKLQQDNTLLDANHAALTQNAVQAFLSKHSRIYGVFSQANLALSINEALYHKIKSALGKLVPGQKKKNKQVAPAYPPQDGWRVTSSLISAMNQTCRESGNKLVVVCFPNVVQDKEYGLQIDAIKQLAATERFSYMDMTPTVRWDPNPMSLFVKYHFSDRGHAVTSEQIIKVLKTDRLI